MPTPAPTAMTWLEFEGEGVEVASGAALAVPEAVFVDAVVEGEL